MHVLGNGSWVAGFLDQAATPERARVEVHRQVALAPVTDQFFVREPQLAMLVSYVRMLGIRRVVRKVRSRHDESLRNDAWLSVGIGRLAEGPGGGPVAFVVPSGPRGVERASLPRELLFPLPADALDGLAVAHFVPRPEAEAAPGLAEPARQELLALAGWNPEEGTSPQLSLSTWEAIMALVAAPPAHRYDPAPARPAPSAPLERSRPVGVAGPAVPGGPGGAPRPELHVFGLGQYAKTQVIANLGERLHLACVHEINPFQIGPVTSNEGPTWDTSPVPRDGERIEHAAVAGYHHTHAPLAVDLLDRGAKHVVIEKPVATTVEQLDALTAALERNPGARVHSAFQRRYSPFNRHLTDDLGGGPISMSASVYEVPLPARHWYRWPIVGNAVVSNGCHWIDHFLHLNGYPEVTRLAADVLGTQTVLTLALANGASCSISLRHEGAPRRGVRDLCTFWNGDASAVIEDSRRYRAEKGFRQVRRASCHPYRALEDMYREFGRRIELDAPGDDIRTITMSTRTVLDLARLAGSAP